MKYFRVTIPNFGVVYVMTYNATLAQRAAERYLAREGVSAHEIGPAQEVTVVPYGVELVDSGGNFVYRPQPAPPTDSSGGAQGSTGGSSTPGEDPQDPTRGQGAAGGSGGGSQPPGGSTGSGSSGGSNSPASPGSTGGSSSTPGQGTTGSTGSSGGSGGDSASQPAPYRVYRVTVPGLGALWITAQSEQGAVSAAITFAGRTGVNIGRTDAGSLQATLAPEGITASANGYAIDRDGYSRELVNGRSLFRVSVQPIGDIYVVARDAALAEAAAQRHAESILGEGATPSTGTAVVINFGDLPMDTSPELVINEDGGSESDLLPGADGNGLNLPEGFFDSASLPLVAKYYGPGGAMQVVAVTGVPANISLDELGRLLPEGSAVQDIATLQEYFERNDADIIDLWRRAGGAGITSASQLIQNIGVIDLSDHFAEDRENDQDDTTGSGGSDGGDNGDGSGGGASADFDIQNFPLATYLNAVEGLGFNPNGVLESILTNRFYEIDPARDIGQALGTIAPAGNVPGDLASQYQDLFGNLTLSGDVFRDLLAARSAGNDAVSITDYTDPNIVGGGKAAEVLALARAAAAERYGTLFANSVLPSYQRLITEYQRLIADANGEPEESFLDFARRQSLLPVDF